jgi:hypothetical protein
MLSKKQEPINKNKMEPLKDLFDLYEQEVRKARPKPPLQPETPATLDTPYEGDVMQNPVVKQRTEIDQLERQGMAPEDAFQSVVGPVNLADPEYKAKLAATQARFEKQNQRGNVHPEPNSGSIFSNLEKKKKSEVSTETDLKTPSDLEVPDIVQKVSEEFDIPSNIDYNDDVDYLRKYGRA